MHRVSIHREERGLNYTVEELCSRSFGSEKLPQKGQVMEKFVEACLEGTGYKRRWLSVAPCAFVLPRVLMKTGGLKAVKPSFLRT